MDNIETIRHLDKLDDGLVHPALANAARDAFGPGGTGHQLLRKAAEIIDAEATSEAGTCIIDGVPYPVTKLPAGTAQGGFNAQGCQHFSGRYRPPVIIVGGYKG